MIGDRASDITSGHSCGMLGLGVLYGSGSLEELQSARADYLAATPADIVPLLLGLVNTVDFCQKMQYNSPSAYRIHRRNYIMYQSMKRQSLLAAMPRMILALVLAAVLLAVSCRRRLDHAGRGKRPQRSGCKRERGRLCQLRYEPSDERLCVLVQLRRRDLGGILIVRLDNDIYLSMRADGKSEEKFERATDQSYDYYRNDSGIMNQMGTISGQVTALDDESYQSMSDWITPI